VQDAFRIFARRASEVLGTAWSFVIAIIIIVIWGVTGHVFHYSDTWQLIINTGDNHRYLPDGVPDSKYAEPRLDGSELEA